MKNFIQEGRTITVVAPYNVTSGGGVQVGTLLFGVAEVTALSGASVDIVTVGVYDLAKDTSTFSSGDPVYWDNINYVATSNPTNHILIGACDLSTPSGTNALGNGSGDATVRVRLNGAFQGTSAVTTTVNLSAANLIAMNGTPVSVLPAPGAGLAILVDNILFEMTTTATVFTGGGVVTFPYHGGSVATHAGSVPAATVTATAGTTYTLLGEAVASNGTVVPANTGVDVTNATAPFAAGTGTAKVQLRYRIVTL